MKTFLIAAALVALAAPAPALARQAPPPAVAAAVDPATRADAPVDPERLALAKDMLLAMDVQHSIKGMFSNIFKNMPIAPGPSTEASDHARRMFASFGAGMEAVMPQMMDDMTVVYARVLTADELRDAAAFYRSKSGRALLEKLPLITQQSAPISFKYLPKILESAEADYCAHGSCTDAERSAFQMMAQMFKARPPAQ